MAFIGFLALAIILFGLVYVLTSVVNFLAGGATSNGKRSHSKNSILAPIRQRFGAENKRATQLGEFNVFRPALVFDYGRTMARVLHSGTPWRKTNMQTTLDTDFPLRPSGQTISVISRGSGAEPLFFIKTGDEDFDRAFYVLATNPALANQLLTDAVRWKMMEIKELQESEIKFELVNGKLKTSTQQWFRTGQTLLDFVQGGLELFDQLMLHKADGLEFTGQNKAAVMEDFRCPICSDDVMHEMVVCRRCKTPHCAECWEYNGKCATFACMEERCIRVNEQKQKL